MGDLSQEQKEAYERYLGARYVKELKAIRSDSAFIRESVAELDNSQLAKIQSYIETGDAVALGVEILRAHAIYTDQVAQARILRIAKD